MGLMNTLRSRPWKWQFTVRLPLLLMVAVSLLLTWKLREVYREREVATAIEHLGGSVTTTWKGPKWLKQTTRHLFDPLYLRVISVKIPDCDEATQTKLLQLPWERLTTVKYLTIGDALRGSFEEILVSRFPRPIDVFPVD